MANTYKAIAIANELADKLKARLNGSRTVTQSSDTDGNPLITVDDGTPAAGEQNALIKVMPADWPLALDIFGNAANAYGPEKICLVTELSATAGETLFSGANILQVLGECIMRGTIVEWYMSTNGSAPATTDIAAAKLKGTFHPNVYRPLISAQ